MGIMQVTQALCVCRSRRDPYVRARKTNLTAILTILGKLNLIISDLKLIVSKISSKLCNFKVLIALVSHFSSNINKFIAIITLLVAFYLFSSIFK